MGGIVGCSQSPVTLSIAILISMVISLTTTPMMCAYVLKPPRRRRAGEAARRLSRASAGVRRHRNAYDRTLAGVALSRLTMLVFWAR
jgi:multidrug efflux pump